MLRNSRGLTDSNKGLILQSFGSCDAVRLWRWGSRTGVVKTAIPVRFRPPPQITLCIRGVYARNLAVGNRPSPFKTVPLTNELVNAEQFDVIYPVELNKKTRFCLVRTLTKTPFRSTGSSFRTLRESNPRYHHRSFQIRGVAPCNMLFRE